MSTTTTTKPNANANANANTTNTTTTSSSSSPKTIKATNTNITQFQTGSGSLINAKEAARQRTEQRKIAAANKLKLMAEAGTSMFVRILDGQEMIADFKDFKYEETEVEFDDSGVKTPRHNYTVLLLQDPATRHKIPLPGRTVIFSCSKTVSAEIDEWITDDYEILKISRTGSDKHDTKYKVRGLEREAYIKQHQDVGFYQAQQSPDNHGNEEK
jgi:hypothetical protein